MNARVRAVSVQCIVCNIRNWIANQIILSCDANVMCVDSKYVSSTDEFRTCAGIRCWNAQYGRGTQRTEFALISKWFSIACVDEGGGGGGRRGNRLVRTNSGWCVLLIAKMDIFESSSNADGQLKFLVSWIFSNVWWERTANHYECHMSLAIRFLRQVHLTFHHRSFFTKFPIFIHFEFQFLTEANTNTHHWTQVHRVSEREEIEKKKNYYDFYEIHIDAWPVLTRCEFVNKRV